MTDTPQKNNQPLTFRDLGLNDEVVASIEAHGYERPTPIQSQAIAAFLDGKDIIAQSQTGTGKTAAFVLPLLNSLRVTVRRPQALILAPTRELVMQIGEEVRDLSRQMRRIRSVCLFGGQPKRLQKRILNQGAQIIAGTPGRVMDMLESGALDASWINFFVLDEVDRMLDMGFIDDVKKIYNALPRIDHVMTFSATMTREVRRVVDSMVKNETTEIVIDPAPVAHKIDHAYMDVPHHDKLSTTKGLLDVHEDDKVVIFTQTKSNTAAVAEILQKNGYRVCALHGDMDQRDRMKTLKNFKNNDHRVLVATDVAARGLNMKDINLVINYDVPEDPESYIHRIGRTGRAGASGRAIMFVDREEMGVLARIEHKQKVYIKKVDREGNEVERPQKLKLSGGGGRGGRGGRRYGGRGGNRGRSGGGYRNRSGGGGGGYRGGRNARSGGGGGPRSGGYRGGRR